MKYKTLFNDKSFDRDVTSRYKRPIRFFNIAYVIFLLTQLALPSTLDRSILRLSLNISSGFFKFRENYSKKLLRNYFSFFNTILLIQFKKKSLLVIYFK